MDLLLTGLLFLALAFADGLVEERVATGRMGLPFGLFVLLVLTTAAAWPGLYFFQRLFGMGSQRPSYTLIGFLRADWIWVALWGLALSVMLAGAVLLRIGMLTTSQSVVFFAAWGGIIIPLVVYLRRMLSHTRQ